MDENKKAYLLYEGYTLVGVYASEAALDLGRVALAEQNKKDPENDYSREEWEVLE
jgi:hypothetical protein